MLMKPDRRQVIRSAAGLLVPACVGLVASPASAIDVERKHRRRKPRRKPPQMFVDDVVANVWNRTEDRLGLYFTSTFTSGNHVSSDPGNRSRYNQNIDPTYYGTDLAIDILSFRVGSTAYKYRVVLENPEIGSADVSISRLAESKLDLVMADNLSLKEGHSVTRTDKIVRIQIYRHEDGKIEEDDYDEEYCRFEVSIFRA
jgi:hypothetical protein